MNLTIHLFFSTFSTIQCLQCPTYLSLFHLVFSPHNIKIHTLKPDMKTELTRSAVLKLHVCTHRSSLKLLRQYHQQQTSGYMWQIVYRRCSSGQTLVMHSDSKHAAHFAKLMQLRKAVRFIYVYMYTYTQYIYTHVHTLILYESITILSTVPMSEWVWQHNTIASRIMEDYVVYRQLH